MQNQIAVVGGCNIDISATSYTFLIEADSNPGYVKTTLGGVGRNIAENLLLLGPILFTSASIIPTETLRWPFPAWKFAKS